LSATVFSCLNCGGDRSRTFYEGCPDYYLGKPFRVDYVKCDRCGLVQQSPIPSDVSVFYEAYPVHREKSPLHNLARRLIMSASYADASAFPEGAVVLDYGCGDGWYLDSLRGRGFTLLGFEPNAEHSESLSARLDLPVFGDAGALVEQYAGGVDIVTMHFVLEHVTDLHSTFADVAKLLKPGGRFRFVVPNIDSWEARVFRKKWHGLDPPRHISFPDRSVAEGLAKQYGMVMVEQRPVPFPNGIAGSIPVILTGRFVYPLFLASLPLGVLLSRLAPAGCTAFSAVKDPVPGDAHRQ